MKKTYLLITFALTFIIMSNTGCKFDVPDNTSAVKEQAHTEQNQTNLNQVQPPPTITWSLERDNLIKRFKLQNDRAVLFYMYVFIEGVSQPIGYYQVNKVSSVNSQLTNTMQIISGMRGGNDLPSGQIAVVPSPAEDGSYGTNGDGVFGFTPEDIYIETNMKYITSTVPLHFNTPVTKLAVISSDEAQKMLDVSKKAMGK
jgi:hypothetical protein